MSTSDVDGETQYDASTGDYTPVFIPFTLAKGLHALRVAGRPINPVELRVLFGGGGAYSLSGTNFRQPPPEEAASGE